MANLVSPGYNKSTLIGQTLHPAEERIIEFKGLNTRSVVEEGEMSDMWNLSTDNYPTLMVRKPRGRMAMPEGLIRPIRLVRRFEKIGIIGIEEESPETVVSFYYDGVKVDEIAETETLPGLSTESRAVAINNIMCFFPQKTCIDITKDGVQEGTYRSLEASYTVPTGGISVTVTTSETSLVITKGLFKYDDAISIKGTLTYNSSSLPVEISCPIEKVEEVTINNVEYDKLYLPVDTFIEAQGASNVKLAADTTIKRTMPDLDLVVEWNNRLWGVNNDDNTIYASKLGDPTNWQYYQGTSLDSYYAQQGTDETFTAIAEYSGHLIFFKPNSMTRVYGTAPSNYQITNTKAFGVEYGSGRSVLTINDTVFYKSSIGFMAYQGGVPVCISNKLEQMNIKNVVAGTEGQKYYASCKVKEENTTKDRVLVFDIDKAMWHMEDDLRFVDSIKVEDKIYMATAEPLLVCDTDIYVQEEGTPEEICVTGDYTESGVLIVNPDKIMQTHAEASVIDPANPPENYEDMTWTAVFGPFDEYIEEHKIYSKLAMRLRASNIGEASANVFISIDEGPWEQVLHCDRISTKGDFIPIIPRRCDRYSVKIEGKGNCEVKSLTRRVRRGSFGRL